MATRDISTTSCMPGGGLPTMFNQPRLSSLFTRYSGYARCTRSPRRCKPSRCLRMASESFRFKADNCKESEEDSRRAEILNLSKSNESRINFRFLCYFIECFKESIAKR